MLLQLQRPAIEQLVPADLFDAWLFAEADATLAMADWGSAPREDKADAYAAYVAARLLELRLSYA